MYAGRIVEHGTLDEIFYDPSTRTRGAARLDHARRPLRGPSGCRRSPGLPPSLADRPEGCHFRPRCPHEFDKCSRCRRSRRAWRGTPEHSRPLLAHPEQKQRAPSGEAGRDRPGRQVDRGGRRVSVHRTAGSAPGRAGRLAHGRRAAHRHRAPEGLLPDQAGLHSGARGCARSRRERRDFLDRRGRDGRARGGVGLREDDHVAGDHAPDRCHGRAAPLPRRRHHPRRPQGARAAPAPDADGLPGPVRVAEPAQARGADHRPAAAASTDAARARSRTGCASC